ncbi:MAG: HEAT repeat domain-containing protein [Myxococcota bacterium]
MVSSEQVATSRELASGAQAVSASAALPFVDNLPAAIGSERRAVRSPSGPSVVDLMWRRSLARATPADAAKAVSAGQGVEARVEQNAALFSQLRDSDELVRAQAARGLGRRGNARAVKPLLDAALADTERVRDAAVLSLLDIGGVQAGDALLTILEASAGLDVLQLALMLQGLKEAPRARAEAVLVEHLGHADEEVRVAALSGLCDLVVVTAPAVVYPSLKAGDLRERLLALAVLERHGAEADKAVVKPFLEDKEQRVRSQARDALATLRRRTNSF